MLNNKRINKSVALIGDFNKYQNKHISTSYSVKLPLTLVITKKGSIGHSVTRYYLFMPFIILLLTIALVLK